MTRVERREIVVKHVAVFTAKAAAVGANFGCSSSLSEDELELSESE